jgi:hypothetical protein
MKWELSDGTEVFLGGRVRGTSPAAEYLRADVLAVKGGSRVPVQVETPPAKARRLDIDDAQLVDEWVRASALRFDLDVTSAPELEPIERFNPPDPDDGTTYPIN